MYVVYWSVASFKIRSLECIYLVVTVTTMNVDCTLFGSLVYCIKLFAIKIHSKRKKTYKSLLILPSTNCSVRIPTNDSKYTFTFVVFQLVLIFRKYTYMYVCIRFS